MVRVMIEAVAVVVVVDSATPERGSSRAREVSRRARDEFLMAKEVSCTETEVSCSASSS